MTAVTGADPRAQLLLAGITGHAGPTVTMVAPATGEELGALPTATQADVDAVFARARLAQRPWAAASIGERSAVLLRLHDLVLARRDEALDLVQLETGKARKDALEELLDVCINLRHYARDAERLLRPRRVRGVFPGLVRTDVLHHPKGVVGVLAPWNYPLTLALSDAAPALVAGNAVVLKPDVQTSLIALWVAERLREAGLPQDLFQVALGEGPVVGPWVIDRADYVMFTGSTRVGREVAARCGQRLIGCSLELGGKNAMIVREDADIERAAEIAVRASFSNAGQLCVSMERIYVVGSAYAPFRDAFVRRTEAMRLGCGIGWGSDMGALISPAQRDRVLAHVADAVDRGATLLTGGRALPELGPTMIAPTILEGVNEDMALCAQETFGPVVALAQVATDEEALARANASEYGLNGAVLSRDVRAARALAARMKAGTVNVNEGYASAWGSVRAPMGGMGDSGLGRRHGDDGLLKYTEAQTIGTQRALGWGPPFGWSDERWGGTLVSVVGLMKRLGVK